MSAADEEFRQQLRAGVEEVERERRAAERERERESERQARRDAWAVILTIAAPTLAGIGALVAAVALSLSAEQGL